MRLTEADLAAARALELRQPVLRRRLVALLDSFITARGADGVTLACGHIAEALPASPALSEILALARAVQAGRAPAWPSRQPGVLLFERGNFSLTVKKTDPGVRPAGAMLSPRADRC